jgi:ketosteroid isomerase-like protein
MSSTPGGDDAALRRLLADDVAWTVPGNNAIAGIYRGVSEVFGYFGQRRDLAEGTFRVQRRDVLVGSGDHIAAISDGRATLHGRECHWSTVGLYRIQERRIQACWLLPLDPVMFDDMWAARPAEEP